MGDKFVDTAVIIMPSGRPNRLNLIMNGNLLILSFWGLSTIHCQSMKSEKSRESPNWERKPNPTMLHAVPRGPRIRTLWRRDKVREDVLVSEDV